MIKKNVEMLKQNTKGIPSPDAGLLNRRAERFRGKVSLF
jgi:hypothetical protein